VNSFIQPLKIIGSSQLKSSVTNLGKQIFKTYRKNKFEKKFAVSFGCLLVLFASTLFLSFPMFW
jgi:hypothetical protein